MSGRDHARRMAHTYSTGRFSRIVDAAGEAGFMNLGYASDPLRPGTTRARQRAMAELVLRTAAPRDGDAVLDVGCGKGGLLRLVARQAPTARLTGVNIDRHQILAARRHAASARFLAAAAEDLPFADGCFDVILAVEVLSHVADKDRMAAGFARVLRPGGRAVLAYLALTRPYREFNPDQQAHLRRVAEFFNEHPRDIPTRGQAESVFQRAGLAVTSTTDLTDGVFPPRHQEFLSMLRMMRGRGPVTRAAFSVSARWRWKVHPGQFTEFLRINTAAHPCRFYEYHLMTLTRSA